MLPGVGPRQITLWILGGGCRPPRDCIEVLGGGSGPPKDCFEVLDEGYLSVLHVLHTEKEVAAPLQDTITSRVIRVRPPCATKMAPSECPICFAHLLRLLLWIYFRLYLSWQSIWSYHCGVWRGNKRCLWGACEGAPT